MNGRLNYKISLNTKELTIVQKNNRYKGSNKDNNSDKDKCVYLDICFDVHINTYLLFYDRCYLELEHLPSVEFMYLSLSCRKISHTDILAGHVLRQKSR